MLRKLTAALAALTALVHFFVGGADALAPDLAADLSPQAAGAMLACWHIVTAMLFGSVFVFWRGGEPAFHFGMLWIASAFIYVRLILGGLPGLVTNPHLSNLSCRF